MTATIGKHPERAGVWCVYVPCDRCGGTGHWGPHGADDSCPHCDATGQRILSTHATRDGAAVSANQINRAEANT